MKGKYLRHLRLVHSAKPKPVDQLHCWRCFCEITTHEANATQGLCFACLDIVIAEEE